MQKSNKKILIIINDFLVGGAQKLVISQSDYFIKKGYEVALVTLMDFNEKSDLYSAIHPNVLIYKVNLKNIYDIKGWRRLFLIVQEYQADVAFSHLFLSNMMIRIIGLVLPIRIFTVEHNTYSNKKKRQIFMDRLLAWKSEKIIAVSDEVREFTIHQQKIDPEKCITIANGVDVHLIDAYKQEVSKIHARSVKGIPENLVMFLSVARLTYQKNLGLLINSFVLFHKGEQNTALFILGEGAEFVALQKLIHQNNASNYIKLLGNIDDVFSFYRSADFFISTSKIEGMSMAFLEALAFGLPIIATKTGGTNALIQEGSNGFVISNFDTQSVVGTMHKLMRAEYGHISGNAYQTSRKFSVDVTNRKYEELI